MIPPGNIEYRQSFTKVKLSSKYFCQIILYFNWLLISSYLILVINDIG